MMEGGRLVERTAVTKGGRGVELEGAAGGRGARVGTRNPRSILLYQ